MILYLIKSTLCLGLLLLVYLLFLEKEKMHRFNRWYLLGSIVVAYILPLVSFTIPQESLPILPDNYFEIIASGSSQQPAQTIGSVKESTDYLALTLLITYALIASVLLIRFTRNLYLLLSSAARNRAIAYRGAKLILLKEKVASYSFLNNIFISETDYANQSIEEELITHELTHVKQKHSWDVIFIELLQILFWFNPLFIFYKKAIQLNHEYLADDAVIKNCDTVYAYQNLLLDKASIQNNTCLTSNFNFSVTKKRLIMMTKKYNPIRTIFKKISLVPVLATMILFSSVKIMMAQDKAKTPPEVAARLPKFGDGVSKEQMDEYNAITDRNMTKTKNGHAILGRPSDAERERMLAIYKQMNKDQRNSVRAHFMKEPKPMDKAIPSAEQLEKWKDADTYGVWIGNKKVKNEELNKYKPEDFSHYFVSNLYYTQKMKEDVMKTFNLKNMYKYQLDLMTNTQYDAYYKNSLNRPEYGLFFTVLDGKSRFTLPVN